MKSTPTIRDPRFFGYLALGLFLLGCGWLCGRHADSSATSGIAAVPVRASLAGDAVSALHPISLTAR